LASKSTNSDELISTVMSIANRGEQARERLIVWPLRVLYAESVREFSV